MSGMDISSRIRSAKQSFVTRRVDLSIASGLSRNSPRPGDVCLARVDRLGHHGRIELPCGRRSTLFVGDEVILAFGARYATDQFHSIVPTQLSECQMVASGGIASKVLSQHSSMRPATRITPIGLLANADGHVLSLKDFAISSEYNEPIRRPHVICVVGSRMNSGKTTTVSEIGRLAIREGVRPAAIKLTGTGSGGDLWKYFDSGIPTVFDFTDAGFATTVDVPTNELNEAFFRLLQLAHREFADVIIVELADGIYQKETSDLLNDPRFRQLIDSIVYVASDPVSGVAGVSHLRSIGLEPSVLSGAVTASELSIDELLKRTDVEVMSLSRLQNDERALGLCMQSAHYPTRAHFAELA